MRRRLAGRGAARGRHAAATSRLWGARAARQAPRRAAGSASGAPARSPRASAPRRHPRRRRRQRRRPPPRRPPPPRRRPSPRPAQERSRAPPPDTCRRARWHCARRRTAASTWRTASAARTPPPGACTSRRRCGGSSPCGAPEKNWQAAARRCWTSARALADGQAAVAVGVVAATIKEAIWPCRHGGATAPRARGVVTFFLSQSLPRPRRFDRATRQASRPKSAQTSGGAPAPRPSGRL